MARFWARLAEPEETPSVLAALLADAEEIIGRGFRWPQIVIRPQRGEDRWQTPRTHVIPTE